MASEPNETASTEDLQNKPWLFKPGQSGNPKGRKKGSRNVLGEDFTAALQKDFAEHGDTSIVQLRETDVAAYIRVIASIIPKDVTVKHETVGDELSDDDLARVIDALRARAGSVAPARAITNAETLN